MPAEWEPHESTWLAWPHLRDDWPGKFEPIPWVYAEIVRNLARHERVDLIVNDANWENRARTVLEKAGALSDNVCFHRWRTDRVWTRDSGCIFLVPSADRTVKRDSSRWRCISSSTHGPNIRITGRMRKSDTVWRRRRGSSRQRVSVRPFGDQHRVVLEGGAIDVNGCGTC